MSDERPPSGKLRNAVALAAALLSCVFGEPARSAAPDWQLAWEDNFESFDKERWVAVKSHSPTNHSRHAYLPSQVKIDSGDLVITSENLPAGALPYRSGLVETRESQKYGRWEVRAKLPVSTGMWPAIWLLPATNAHPWPSGGEIDIMESRGNQPTITSSAFHYGTNPPFRHDSAYSEQRTATLAGPETRYDQDYHTYAVDWMPDYLRFYVDGVHHFTVHDEDVDGFLSKNTQPMQLVINTAIGGDFLQNPNENTVWPQEFRIDSVRVFKLAANTGEAKLTNGGLEAQGGSLVGWTVFGNRVDNPNVRVANEAVRTGQASLKVAGSLRQGLNPSGVSQGITVRPGELVQAELYSLVHSTNEITGNDRASLKIDFYRQYGAKQGSAALLSEQSIRLADATTATDRWSKHAMKALAPEGAEEARLSIVFEQPARSAGSIYLDDISFAAVAEPLSRDFNQGGSIRAAAHTTPRRSLRLGMLSPFTSLNNALTHSTLATRLLPESVPSP